MCFQIIAYLIERDIFVWEGFAHLGSYFDKNCNYLTNKKPRISTRLPATN